MVKDNVRQHVVPRFYLAEFADAAGNVHCVEVKSGAHFATDPKNICVEKEAYSIREGGELNKSCDRINTDLEGPVSSVFAKIHPGIDLSDETLAREVFTHLLAFTANLIARSRTPRNERNAQMTAIAAFLKAHPDAFDKFDHGRYLDLLRNPEKHREMYERIPLLKELAPILAEHNEQDPKQPNAAETVVLLEELTTVLYPILTPVLTEKVAWEIHDVKAKAALLVSNTINFITSDDPVIYLHHDLRVQGKQIPPREIWTDPSRAILIPLKPRIALYWNANENYEVKVVDAERVAHLNRQVLANHVRHVFAADPGDFPT